MDYENYGRTVTRRRKQSTRNKVVKPQNRRPSRSRPARGQLAEQKGEFGLPNQDLLMGPEGGGHRRGPRADAKPRVQMSGGWGNRQMGFLFLSRVAKLNSLLPLPPSLPPPSLWCSLCIFSGGGERDLRMFTDEWAEAQSPGGRGSF